MMIEKFKKARNCYAQKREILETKIAQKKKEKFKKNLAKSGKIACPEYFHLADILSGHRDFVKKLVETFYIKTIRVFSIMRFNEESNFRYSMGESVIPFHFDEKSQKITYRFFDYDLRQDITFYCDRNLFLGIQKIVTEYATPKTR